MSAETEPVAHVDHALRYAAAGFKIFPTKIDKTPRTLHGSKDATTDTAQIKKWYGMWGDAGIAIATGHELPGGGFLAVIDIDGLEGAKSLEVLESEIGALPPGIRVKTAGGGGLHIYTRTRARVKNKAGLRPGIDVRGEGGYVICPPSQGTNGSLYEWQGSKEIAATPEEWATLIEPAQRRLTVATVTEGVRVGEGQRHAALISRLGRLVGNVTHAAALVDCLEWNRTQCDPPEDEAEVTKQVANCYENHENGSWEAATPFPVSVTAVPAPTPNEITETIDGLDAALKADPGAAFEVPVLAALLVAQDTDQPAFARARAIMRKHKVPLKMLDAAISKHRAKLREAAGQEATVELADAPMTLQMPDDWRVHEGGLVYLGDEGPEEVLPVPLYLTKRLRTVVEGEEKVELEYKRDGEWRSIICDRSVAGQARTITSLADRGLPVTSESASRVVRYLSALESKNMTTIPLEEATTQAGWIGSSRFFPGMQKGVVFAPPHDSRITPLAFGQSGTMDDWMGGVFPAITAWPLLRLCLAGSLAAPLLRPTNHRSFVLHIWGDSGGGKSVSLETAMSLWGSPSVLVESYNTTAVGLENRLALANGVPTALNERQSSGSKDIDRLIYMIGEGTGRTRGAKGGGLRHTASWSTVVLSNGEEPLVPRNAAQGASTRVLEFPGTPIGDERGARHLYDLVRRSFGHPALTYIKELCALLGDDSECVKRAHDGWLERLDLAVPGRIMSHVSALALCAVADELADKWLWGGALGDTEAWVTELLRGQSTLDSKGEVSREYEAVCDLVSVNRGKFQRGFGDVHTSSPTELWGVFSGGDAWIIPAIFDREMERLGLRSVPAKRRLAKADLLLWEPDGEGGMRLYKRKSGQKFVAVRLPEDFRVSVPGENDGVV